MIHVRLWDKLSLMQDTSDPLTPTPCLRAGSPLPSRGKQSHTARQRRENGWAWIYPDGEWQAGSSALLSPSRQTGPFNSLQSSFHKGRKRASAPYSGGFVSAAFQSDKYSGFRSNPDRESRSGKKDSRGEWGKGEAWRLHREAADLITKRSLQETRALDRVHLPALDPTLNLQLFKPWLCVILTLSLVLLPAASPSLINAQLCEPRIRSGQGNQWLTAQHIRRRIAISTPSHFNHGGWGSQVIALVPVWGWSVCRSHVQSGGEHAEEDCDVGGRGWTPTFPQKVRLILSKSSRRAGLCESSLSGSSRGNGSSPQRVFHRLASHGKHHTWLPLHDFTRVLNHANETVWKKNPELYFTKKKNFWKGNCALNKTLYSWTIMRKTLRQIHISVLLGGRSSCSSDLALTAAELKWVLPQQEL